jgi:hypothetical protein
MHLRTYRETCWWLAATLPAVVFFEAATSCSGGGVQGGDGWGEAGAVELTETRQLDQVAEVGGLDRGHDEPADLPAEQAEVGPDVEGPETGDEPPADLLDAAAEAESGGLEAGEAEAVPPCEPVGQACDDGNACTSGDTCTEDGCLGLPKDCADSLECTFDQCQDGQCGNDLKPGWCFIGGLCYQEATPNPNNPCLECITAHKVYSWSADDLNGCDDGNACTDGDQCSDGNCLGAVDLCDDGSVCTQDVCDSGQCQHLPVDGLACDDGNLCTLGDLCADGTCLPGESLRECDDFNPCTQDTCDPLGGCVYTPMDDLPCEDGNLCTAGDLCKSSVCLPGDPVTCADDNFCTTDGCSPLFGCKFVNNSLPCDDQDPCTSGDQCFGGVCKKGPELTDCDDGNTCTSEWCSPGAGCQYEAIWAACSDGNGCTFGDHCEDGECVHEWEMDCLDDNPCTDDLCDPNFGCANVLNSAPCDDGNACTVGDQCVNGACKKGSGKLSCFDENPCVVGSCDPLLGCVVTAKSDFPCDDGNICTVNDYCAGGECHPGADDVIDCEDGNVCTGDWCDPVLECVHENIEAKCDDKNLCTKNDECSEGSCLGLPVNCDDANACTTDSCAPDQGCLHAVIVSAFCQPQIIIDYPPRAAELSGPPYGVAIQGHVVHNAAPVAWVNVNGNQVAVGPDDKFAFQMQPKQGLNIIEAEVFDKFDGHDKVVQTFLMSGAYTPMNAANPEVSMIHDGVMIFLGQNVWDDNNPDPNDFATFFTYFFNSLNIAGMIPNPLYENGSYKVKGEGLSHGPFSLDITCIWGGIHMVATLPNLHLHLDADSKKWYLPGASGNVDASKLVLSMDVMLSVDGAGNVKANLVNVKADVYGLNVSLDGVLGFLLNWLVDFFEGTFASMLEDQVEAAIKDALPAALEGALEDLAFDSEFEIPPMLGGGQPAKLSLKSKVSTIAFSPTGGVVGLKAAVVTPKGVNLDSKGTIHRSGCLGQEAAFKFWMLDEIEMSLFDDFMNQIPYAMWWAGLLTIPLKPENMGGGNFEEYGIENLSIKATALLPPVITECGYNQLHIEMGDMRLEAEFVMFGTPAKVTMFTTFTAAISIEVKQVNGKNELAMGVTKIDQVALEIATVSENLVGAEDSLKLLIKQNVLPVFLNQITGSALASFPLPEMDMSGMIPGAPPEAKLKMTPKSQYREKGYTVITGSVHE